METTFSTIASQIANLDEGKSQATIGDIREILSKLSVLMVTNPEVIAVLLANGNDHVKKQLND